MHEGINHATHDVPTEVMRITDGRGVDLVYEHVGGKLFQAGLDSLTRDGRLVTCGAHSGEVVDLDIIVLFRNQTRIIGSFTFTSAEYEEVLRLAGLGLLEAAGALDLLARRRGRGVRGHGGAPALRQDRDHAVSEPTASRRSRPGSTDLRYADIDAPTVAYAKELLLDHLGCAARGGTVDTADAVGAHARRDRRRRGHGAHRRRREGAAAAGVGGLRERRARALDRARRHAQRELAAPRGRDDSGGARDRRAAGLERRGAADRDRRRLRGRVPARPRARSAAGLRAGLPPDRRRRAVRGRRGHGEAARPLGRRAGACVRHRGESGGRAPRVLLRRRLDEALPSRLGVAQRLSRRAARAGRLHRPAAGLRGARRRALGLRRGRSRRAS